MKTRLNSLDPPAPKPPGTLSGPGLTLWRSLQSEYAITDSGGLSIMLMACEALSRLREAQAILAREGLTICDARGQPKAHPAVKIEFDCRAQFLAAVKALNFDLEPLQRLGRPGGGPRGKLRLTMVK